MRQRTATTQSLCLLFCVATLQCPLHTSAQSGEEEEEYKDVTSVSAVLLVEDFNITLFAKERGTLFYKGVTGKIGVGDTKEMARNNLSEPKVGEYSEKEGILSIQLKQPFQGLRTVYFSASGGRPRFHRVTWQLFNVKKFANKLPAAKALEKLESLSKDESALVREPVAEALANGGSEAVEILLPLLKDQDVGVRCRAARSLGVIGDDRASQVLSEALKTAKEEGFRKTLNEVIQSLKSKNAT